MAETSTSASAIGRLRDEPGDAAPRVVYELPSTAELGAMLAAALVAAGAAAVVLRGGVVAHPEAYAVILVTNVLGLALAGTLWLRARPGSPFGELLLALAAVEGLVCLSGARSPGLYLAGILAQWVFTIGAVWTIVAFPSGRLDRTGRALVLFPAALLVLCYVPDLFFSSTAHGISAAGRCVDNCPENLLLVSRRPGLAHAFDLAGGIGRALWSLAVVAFVVVRFARASHPRRRIVLPVYVVALLYATGLAADAFVVDVLGLSDQDPSFFRYAFTTTRILYPLGFVAAILLAHAYAGTALAAMARELGSSSSVAAVEQLVRRVLDDPRARLAFWVPRFGGFADRHGRPVELDPSAEWRSWRLFRRSGEKVLALEHDPVLAEDPELVQAVGAATLIALENRRLQRSLLDTIAELRASQRRLVMATAAERRRIERNLHDSTQQKLVAIRIQLELAHEHAPERSALRARLAQLGGDLDDALDELRDVAHGIYPQLLTDEGLPAALREAARRVGVPVELRLDDVGRWPEELETAVYYCCLEALQNVAKHAGDGVRAVLRLWRDERSLRFSVVDDGVGFSMRERSAGAGLTNMADRIGAVGGAVAIRSTPGQGTSVEGRLEIIESDQEASDGR